MFLNKGILAEEQGSLKQATMNSILLVKKKNKNKKQSLKKRIQHEVKIGSSL